MAEKAEIILCYPDHWGNRQKRVLQQAAIDAGLVSGSGLSERLILVEEGRATASFYMFKNPAVAAGIAVRDLPNQPLCPRADLIYARPGSSLPSATLGSWLLIS